MKKILFLSFLCLTTYGFAQNKPLDSLQQLLKHTNKPVEQFNHLIVIWEIYNYAGEQDSTRVVCKKLLKIATDTHDLALQAKANLYMGTYFSNSADYKQSFEFAFKSLALAEKCKDTAIIWLATKEIGVNYKELKNYPDALKYLKKAEVFHKNISDDRHITGNRTYTHLAEVYLAIGQKNAALKYIQLTNEVTSKEKDTYGFARMLYIFAQVYKAKGDLDLAESYYKKCIAYSKEKDIALPYVTATTAYGNYLLDTKQYALSKQYALKSYGKAMHSKNKLGVINAASLLRKVYAGLQQKDSSYYYADIKEVYRDSVFNEQQTNQIQNISFVQQIKEKEDEAKLLEETEQRHQNIQYAFIALGIISFLILFLLLSRSIIVNEKWISFFGILGLLIVFEFINLLIHPYLEDVTHHSPILMLLCLVALASLLIPLHHKLEKWIKEKMIEKNKAIRLTNAKKTIEQLEEKS